VLAGRTSFAASSTDTNVGFCASIAVTCVCPDASTRLYSVAVRTSPFDSGVATSASCTSAPEIATLLVGSMMPRASGAQVLLTSFTKPWPSAPTATRSFASGGESGGPHPGSCTSGIENATRTLLASCAGHAARCPARKMPPDWTPMLLLVPSATKRSNSSAALSLAALSSAALDAGAGAAGSEHAAMAHSSPERNNRAYSICSSPSQRS
jgi:hypothetical protein